MEPLQILLIDDDADLGNMMKLMLSNEAPHFSIDFAESGQECLEHLKSNHVDCILSDYQMPDMDGMELLLSLRNQLNNIPFIFLTGQGNEQLARDAFKNGADDYFTKELGFAHFTRIINSIEQSIIKKNAEQAKLKAEKELEEKQRAFQEEKNKLDLVLDNIGDCITILDTDFRILYQNKAHKDIVGEHIGECCYHNYGNKVGVCEGCPVEATFKDGQAHTLEKSFKKGDDMLHFEIKAAPLRDLSGRMIGSIESARNVTDRKKADRALMDTEHFMNSVFKSIQDGISVVDKDLNIIKVNPATEQWYSHKLPIVGKKCYEVFQNNSRICGGCTCIEAMETGSATYTERPKRDSNGDVVGWIELYNFPLFDNFTGECKGAIEYFRDITERKKLEKQRSDFYAMLTHDIKSPLAAIMGYSDLLADKSNGLNADSTAIVNGIRISSQKIKALVENFLSVSRMEAGILTPAHTQSDISEILEEAYSGFEGLFKKKDLTLRLETFEDLPLNTNVDRNLVQRAVANLLQNAVNYTPKGGNITLRAEKIDDSVVISVTDTGLGIPENEQDRIFEKYYRASNSAGVKGSGLGLSIVKAVAEAHGGRVELISGKGKGSTFRLYLPYFL